MIFRFFLFLYLLYLPLIGASNPNEKVSQILSTIPLEDKLKLESLFYLIFNEDHAAYTLFGNKPVSSSGWFDVVPWENIIESADCQNFNDEWKIWEKYRHLFNIKDYIL